MKVTIKDFGGATVHVDGEGIFSTVVDDVRYESETLAGLRDMVLFRMYPHPAKVEVPFTIIEDGQIRNGLAKAVRRIDGHIQVLWQDTDTLGFVTWNHRTLKPLGAGDADTYRRMVAARDMAARAVERFERSHAINLKDEISAALAAGNEREETDE